MTKEKVRPQTPKNPALAFLPRRGFGVVDRDEGFVFLFFAGLAATYSSAS
jgi:hypothetical protein